MGRGRGVNEKGSSVSWGGGGGEQMRRGASEKGSSITEGGGSKREGKGKWWERARSVKGD